MVLFQEAFFIQQVFAAPQVLPQFAVFQALLLFQLWQLSLEPFVPDKGRRLQGQFLLIQVLFEAVFKGGCFRSAFLRQALLLDRDQLLPDADISFKFLNLGIEHPAQPGAF